MNETHKQITHLRAMDRPIEQRILAMQNRLFDSSLDDMVIEWGPRLPQKQSQWTPMPQQICHRLAQSRVRLRLVSIQLIRHPLM